MDMGMLRTVQKDGSLDWLIERAINLLTDVGRGYFDSMKAHLWQNCSKIKAVKTRIRRLVQLVQLAMMATEDDALVDSSQTSNKQAWEKAKLLLATLPKQIEVLCRLDITKADIECQLPEIVGEKLEIEDELEQAKTWRKWELASQLKTKLDEHQAEADAIRKKLETVDAGLQLAVELQRQTIVADAAIQVEIAQLEAKLTGSRSSSCTKADFSRMLDLETQATILKKLLEKLKRISVVRFFTHPWTNQGLAGDTLRPSFPGPPPPRGRRGGECHLRGPGWSMGV
jgi:hypothetical protein